MKMWYSKVMESKKNTQKKTNFKTKAQKTKAKLLSAYYGNPIRDMKLICITGTSGKSVVAHFTHEILRAAGQHVAVLASDQPIKTTLLHKFLSDAWKAGSNYVIVTAPAKSLKDNVFYGLPVHVAALTDFTPASLDAPTPAEYVADETVLFNMKPEIVILNQDDAHYDEFSKFTGTTDTLTYGFTTGSTIHIDTSKLYKKGTEASLSLGSSHFTTASFLTGEPVVSYMACAAAIATALHISSGAIADGIANYDPETK